MANRTFSQNQREELMRGLTTYLRSLANRRSSGTVTADDVHNFLTRKGVREGMVRTRLSFVNAVFSNGFRPVGTRPSSRPAARGRSITEYTTR